MSTTTIDDELAEIRARIDRLRALEAAGVASGPDRIRRHVDVLQRKEAAVETARRHAPGTVDEKLAQLRMRLNVAEHSLAADVSGDWSSFEAAVEQELRGWDTYLERLQTSVVARAWNAREQAEAAIGAIRSHRIEVDERLAQARRKGSDGRERITAARDELERRADELSAKLT